MIWHFFEVWLLMLAAFAVGCPLGAAAYAMIARSPMAGAQANVADAVGDVVDGIKSRLGIGPVWRPEYRRIVERPDLVAIGPDHEEVGSDREAEPELEWVDEAGAREVLLLTDRTASWQEEQGEPGDIGGSADDAPVVDEGTPAVPSSADDEDVARPMSLAGPRNGVPDDLQRIRGIGERNERRLNKLGIFHFGQIAAWTPAEMRWVARQMAFPERIDRDDWIGQAIVLASGGDTGFVKAAERRRARRRQLLEEWENAHLDAGTSEESDVAQFDDDYEAIDLSEEPEALTGEDTVDETATQDVEEQVEAPVDSSVSDESSPEDVPDLPAEDRDDR